MLLFVDIVPVGWLLLLFLLLLMLLLLLLLLVSLSLVGVVCWCRSLVSFFGDVVVCVCV